MASSTAAAFPARSGNTLRLYSTHLALGTRLADGRYFSKYFRRRHRTIRQGHCHLPVDERGLRLVVSPARKRCSSRIPRAKPLRAGPPASWTCRPEGPSHPRRFHARGKKECAICSRLVLEYDCPGAGHRAVVGRPTRVVVRERLAFQPDATGAEARRLRPARALAWLCLRPGTVPPLSAGRLLHLPLAV